MKEILGLSVIILFVIVLIGLGPVLTIISINTLFGLNIAINIWTWLSTVWLFGVFALRFRKFK